MSGTAALSQPLFALMMGVAAAPVSTEAMEPRHSLAAVDDSRAFAYCTRGAKTTFATLAEPLCGYMTTASVDVFYLDALDRETTPKEHTIGELRRWKLLGAGWDGERAQAPITASVRDAITFARLLSDSATAEPMLHASGRAGLFWRESDLYADLEFLGDSRIAYFIERNGDKHKGVVNFDAKEMPAVLEAVLPV